MTLLEERIRIKQRYRNSIQERIKANTESCKYKGKLPTQNCNPKCTRIQRASTVINANKTNENMHYSTSKTEFLKRKKEACSMTSSKRNFNAASSSQRIQELKYQNKLNGVTRYLGKIVNESCCEK